METDGPPLIPGEIAVICPALNEQSHVARAVASARQAGAETIIVVDGGSVDDTVARASNAGAFVLTGPRGRARQQNLGAAQTTAPVLLFLHADCWLAPDCLRQICDALNADPPIQWGAFRQQIDHRGWLYRGLEWGNAWRVRRRKLPFGDQAIFVRRAAFWAVGGFPDEPFLEDLVLSSRLRAGSCPKLLPGPLGVAARHWQARGVVRQTVRNLKVQWAFARGASPAELWQNQH